MAMAATVFDTAQPMVVDSPEWWLKRLLGRLSEQAAMCADYHTFYSGSQPLAFASQKFAAIFGARYARLPANFMPLVVRAKQERLIVQGFRFGTPGPDKGVWKIWQQNQLDAESQIAHEIALVKGIAYTLVVPGPDGPQITIEDPTQMVLETAPGNRRNRLAALKVWHDEDGFLRAYLYLPDASYKWRSQKRREEVADIYRSSTWEPLQIDGEDFPVTNPLGTVPVIPLLNWPDWGGNGRSEITPVMGNQNAINKLRFDALVASEYVAFPQRWATNIDIPVDPDTGKPLAPFKPGVDNLWLTRRPTVEESAMYGDKVPPTQFGQFAAGDLGPYIDMIREEIVEMSSISATPYHYLLGSPNSNPPSGEALKSSEAPLVRRIVGASIHLGEGWEETMRVAMLAAGQPSKARTDGETIWADPETRNEAARTDSILKQYQAGLLPDEFALEELGYSQQQIVRIAALRVTATPAKIDAAGVLVRSGFDPAAALTAVGLDPIAHLGLLPITVKDAPQLPATDGTE
jgi:hypothetical protein